MNTEAVLAPVEPLNGQNGAPRGASGDADPSTDAAGRPAWLDWIYGKVDSDGRATLAVLILGVLLFIPFLGSLGLWDPWETHYGEVARAMVQRNDYVYPYWESAYFFSKPVLTLWLMALGIFATGSEGGAPGEPLGAFVEWGVRMPFALIAIGTMWAVYRVARHITGDRVTGLLTAIVLASCPQFIFIGKQAITDMPLVGFLTIGIALFILAVFDDQDDAKADRTMRIITSLGIALAVFPQLILIGVKMKRGVDLIGIVGAGVVALGFIGAIMTISTRRQCYLAGFYVCAGLASLAKSPLAVLGIIGPVVVIYCLIAWDWSMFWVRSLWWVGGFLFLTVAAPWYVVLTLFKGRDDEGLTFTERFWFHDNFNRVGSGVHGDRGGLAYYIDQLAYGMFPWSATIPFAMGLAARNAAEEPRVQRRRATLFVLIWALWCYLLFTFMLTKFHHYVFPSVPAFAILIGLWFAWIAKKPKERLGWGMAVLICALFATVVRDIVAEPNSLVNLFTYKYDRDFPREVRPWNYILPITIGGAAMFIELGSGFRLTKFASRLLYPLSWIANKAMKTDDWTDTLPKPRPDLSVLAFGVTAMVFGAWVSHHHFNMMTPHWSQGHLFQTYFDEKKGNEPIYAYQLNWRGETFYSRNRVLQVKERGANERIRNLVDQEGREFIVTEQSRFHTLKNTLSPDKRDKLQIIDRSNNHFYLCVVEE